MEKPNAAQGTLIIGALGAIVLCLLGKETAAVALIVVEAIVWATIHTIDRDHKK